MRLLMQSVMIGGFLLAGCGTPAGNQNTNDNQIDDGADVVLDENFEQEMLSASTTGTTEGTVCAGFYPETPNHTLMVASGANMAVGVSNDEGTALLWVLCGQSNFCGEQAGNLNEVSRFWNTGDCEIYVGTAQQDETIEYTIEFTVQ
ncbi:MAG: hypothetical protein HJJLKODD_00447 [Phycisphaerae bacterium]|nr:hypothetical protein [Phycisphaerae bacterium]